LAGKGHQSAHQKMTKSANSTSASNYLFVELNMNMELSDGIGFIFFLKCE